MPNMYSNYTGTFPFISLLKCNAIIVFWSVVSSPIYIDLSRHHDGRDQKSCATHQTQFRAAQPLLPLRNSDCIPKDGGFLKRWWRFPPQITQNSTISVLKPIVLGCFGSPPFQEPPWIHMVEYQWISYITSLVLKNLRWPEQAPLKKNSLRGWVRLALRRRRGGSTDPGLAAVVLSLCVHHCSSAVCLEDHFTKKLASQISVWCLAWLNAGIPYRSCWLTSHILLSSSFPYRLGPYLIITVFARHTNDTYAMCHMLLQTFFGGNWGELVRVFSQNFWSQFPINR